MRRHTHAVMLATTAVLTACTAGPASVTTEQATPDRPTASTGTADVPSEGQTAASPAAAPATTEPGTTEPAAAGDLHVAYVEAITAYTDEGFAQAADLTAPGSPAAAYVTYRQVVLRSDRQAGYRYEADELDVDGGTITTCVQAENEEHCADFADFQIADGQILSFSVDGVPIDGRIAAGGEPVTVGPLTATPLTAYRAATSDQLIVMVDVSNSSDRTIDVDVHMAELVDTTGAQSTVETWQGATDLRPGATTTALFMFGPVDPGGTLYLTGWDDTDRLDLPVPVPSP